MKGLDPYLSLGFGLIAYRKSLFSLMCLFMVMSVTTHPILTTYESGIAIDANLTTSKYGTKSLGNLGYSSIQCTSVPFGMGKLVLSCPYGSISGIVKNGLGINEKGSNYTTACLVNATTFGNDVCSNDIDSTTFYDDFDNNCIGNETCSFTFGATNKYVKSTANKTCTDDRSSLFVQYKCEITEEEQYEKYNNLTLVTVSILFSAFLYSLLVYWLQQTSKLDQIKYDLKTITAGDFTVEYDITEQMYRTFLKDNYEKDGKNQKEESGDFYSPALYLKKYLGEKVGEIISESVKYNLEKD